MLRLLVRLDAGEDGGRARVEMVGEEPGVLLIELLLLLVSCFGE